MIRNLILDFGGVFINLDAHAVPRGLRKYGVEHPGTELVRISEQYEKGEISSEVFLKGVQKGLPGSEQSEIKDIWNAMIADFPEERLQYIKKLKESNRYRIFLLSNTNALHIEQVKENMGMQRFNQFYNCFDEFYLSHEIGMRKPNPEIFAFVLQQNSLRPEQTLFVDDTLEHTQGASSLGIRTWHLNIEKESILQLAEQLEK